MFNTNNGWSTIIGHEWAVEMLTGALANERLAHAYLLTGPAHIGKTALARTLAQVLNCELAERTPCLVCRACRLIAQDGHPDVRVLRPEPSSSGRTETFRIEQVRELQKELALSPYEGRYRVAILTRFEKASTGAANALLKTLEEPPGRVVLILTAESADALLPTIVSRCQVLALRPLSLEKVEAALLFQWNARAEQARHLAHLSGGRLGLAVRMLTEPRLLEGRQEYLDALESLLQSDRTARFAYADRLARQSGAAVQEVLELWLSWWRDVMLAAGARADAVPTVNIDRVEQIRMAAGRYGLSTASVAVRALRQAIQQVTQNANLRLVLEVLLLNLPLAE